MSKFNCCIQRCFPVYLCFEISLMKSWCHNVTYTRLEINLKFSGWWLPVKYTYTSCQQWIYICEDWWTWLKICIISCDTLPIRLKQKWTNQNVDMIIIRYTIEYTTNRAHNTVMKLAWSYSIFSMLKASSSIELIKCQQKIRTLSNTYLVNQAKPWPTGHFSFGCHVQGVVCSVLSVTVSFFL